MLVEGAFTEAREHQLKNRSNSSAESGLSSVSLSIQYRVQLRHARVVGPLTHRIYKGLRPLGPRREASEVLDFRASPSESLRPAVGDTPGEQLTLVEELGLQLSQAVG